MINYKPPHGTPLHFYIQELANSVRDGYSDCREKSLVITKLEEASMWAERMHYNNIKNMTVRSDTIPEV